MQVSKQQKSRKELLLEFKAKKGRKVTVMGNQDLNTVENLDYKSGKNVKIGKEMGGKKYRNEAVKTSDKQPLKQANSVDSDYNIQSLENSAADSDYKSLENSAADSDYNIQMNNDSTGQKETELNQESPDDINTITDTINLSLELESRNNEILSLRSKNSALLVDLEALKSELVKHYNIEVEFADTEKVVAEKERLIAELYVLIEGLEERVEELVARPNQFADQWIDAAKQDLDAEAEIVQLRGKVTALSSDLEKGKTNHSLALSEIKAQKSTILDLESKLAESENFQMELKSEALEAFEMISSLDSEMEKTSIQVKQLQELLAQSQDRVLELDCSIARLEDEKIERVEALRETIAENQKLHSMLEKQTNRNLELESDFEAVYEATTILEERDIELNNTIIEKTHQLENLELELYKLSVSNGIEADLELVKALAETTEQNKELWQAISSKNSDLESTVKPLFDKIPLEESRQILKTEVEIQTDLDLNQIEAEFTECLKGLKLADLSNNVIYQKSLAQFEYFQDQVKTLQQENRLLQNLIEERSNLESRLLKGLEAANERILDLEREMSATKSQS